MKDLYSSVSQFYPDGFPQPLTSGYSFSYRQNTTSTKMQSGWTRKRAITEFPVRSASLSFRMTKEEFQAWHSFVHSNAFNWMFMNLLTDTTGTSGLSSHLVRFSSPVTWQYIDWNTIAASVTVDMFRRTSVATAPDVPDEIPDTGDGAPTPPGDGTSSVVGEVDIADNPKHETYSFDRAISIPFRTVRSEWERGKIYVSSSKGEVRVWVSDSPTNPPIDGLESTGSVVSLIWGQGGFTAHLPRLQPGFRYSLNISSSGRDVVTVGFS